MNHKKLSLIKEKICNQIKTNADIAIIGLSGGIDSTLVATLCENALGAKKVYGVSMPYNNIDRKVYNHRSTEMAKILKINHKVVSIYSAVVAIENGLTKISSLNLGNIKSRIRMAILYSISTQLGEKFPNKAVRVIGTGNLSEDWIGYDTKGGDALADFFPIGELLKSEVYQLAEYFKIPEEFIDRTPSAGLEKDQTDEKDLGYSYGEMEDAVLNQFTGIIPSLEYVSDVYNFVFERHQRNKHKHEAIPVFSLREIIDDN